MKKNKKIITAALGSAALAGGITVAAVAQACGGDTGRNEAQDITNIVTSINELSNYNPTSGMPSTDLSDLANGILSSFILALVPNSAAPGTTFTITQLGTIQATNSLVSANTSDNGYTLENLAVTGIGTLSSDTGETYSISGTLTLAITVNNGVLTAGTASGITAVNEETAIVNAVNLLSSYTNGTSITNNIATEILSQTNSSLPTGFTLNSLSFADISVANLSLQDDTYTATVANVVTLGTLTSGEVATSFGSLVITVTETSGQFNVTTVSLTTPTSVEQTVIAGINDLSAYTGTTPSSPLGVQFLAAINNFLSGQPLMSSMFTAITASNITIGANNTTIEVSIPGFSGTSGTATSPNVTGTAIVTITIDGGTGDLAISPTNGVTGLTATSPGIAVILTALNGINGYAENVSNQSALSLSMISALENAQVDNMGVFTFGRIGASAFNAATIGDIQEVNSTTWNASLNTTVSQQAGVTLHGESVTPFGSEFRLQITENSGTYTASLQSSNEGRFNLSITILSQLINPLNNTTNFQPGSSSTAPIIVAAINAVAGAYENENSDVVPQSWTFTSLTIFDVTIIGGNYTVLFNNFVGAANSISDPATITYRLTGNLGVNNDAISVVFIPATNQANPATGVIVTTQS